MIRHIRLSFLVRHIILSCFMIGCIGFVIFDSFYSETNQTFVCGFLWSDTTIWHRVEFGFIRTEFLCVEIRVSCLSWRGETSDSHFLLCNQLAQAVLKSDTSDSHHYLAHKGAMFLILALDTRSLRSTRSSLSPLCVTQQKTPLNSLRNDNGNFYTGSRVSWNVARL